MSDNTSNNDAMIRNLEEINIQFNGAEAQARCFLHTTNLTAKSLMRLFDPWLQRKSDSLIVEDKDVSDLTNGMLKEEEITQSEVENTDGEIQDNDRDGWVDDVEVLTTDERRQLLETIKPVKLALMKVDLKIYSQECFCWSYLHIAEASRI